MNLLAQTSLPVLSVIVSLEVKRKQRWLASASFLRFAPATCKLSCDWFIGLPVCFVIGQNDYFGFLLGTQEKTALK